MAHKRFPDRLAFVLNNPLRNRLSPPERLISKLDVGPQDVVVDFGCGPGFLTVPLAKIARKAVGVDVSARMLEKAASYAKRRGVTIETIESDGTHIELPNDSTDLVLLAHVFHEIEDRSRALAEFLRILKPAGRLAVVERTQGSKVLSRFGLGPPVINEGHVVDDFAQAGFTVSIAVPHGRDSIMIGRKPGPSDSTR